MIDLMIDIETLGTYNDSVILSISAVQFNLRTGKTGKAFHADIRQDDCEKHGLRIDPNTVKWWQKQGKDAQERVFNPRKTYGLKQTMEYLNRYIQENFNCNYVQVWANSPSFDCVIIKEAMSKVGIKPIWRFWNERDVRTMVNINPEVKKIPFTGIKHYGVDDCKHQIKMINEVYKSIK